MPSTRRKVLTQVAAPAILLWFVALFLTAYISTGAPIGEGITNDGADYSGLDAFLHGLISIFQPFPYGIAWAANILMLMVINRLLDSDFKRAKHYSIAACICSLFALFINKIPLNESGDYFPVTLGPAVYVWIAAVFVLCGSVFIYAHKATKKISNRAG